MTTHYPLTQINITGYRRLFSIEMKMRPLMVMIGANGVGKTSVLDVFSLLTSAAQGKLKNILSQFGGINDILTADKTDKVSFKVSMARSRFSLDYSLTLNKKGMSYEIGSETLVQENLDNHNSLKYIDANRSDIRYFHADSHKLVRPTWEHSPFETSLFQTSKFSEVPERVRQQFASMTHYSAYALNVGYNAPIRSPQKMQPATHPGHNGEDLVCCLYYLRETDRTRFEVIEDTLAVAFPSFERLDFPPVAAGILAMTWKEKNFSKPLYMNQLSEGILRFLWLITLLHSPDLTAVTLIDEPEVSLHPQLLSILTDVMSEVSEHTQLIVATHSERLVRFLSPQNVLVMDEEEGLAQMKWADTLDLDEWLEEYALKVVNENAK
ncbi:AAA family ATPase [Candidatus Marithioploca araucensis]|uniref:AAA family ATPase n=1 Tax=Candidatus Marithioploca araucensis TaxID=70273 RepID=A0ABT7VS55_9GAMM|nr:AAA family ATPase [Candidatus Marithioploca araucensis]